LKARCYLKRGGIIENEVTKLGKGPKAMMDDEESNERRSG